MASVLLTVGELALVAGPSLRPHIGDLLPLIIDAVQDPADSQKRNVAVVTLGNVRIN
jgi:FKBP12-rapamycin complex-associated protein